MASSTFNTCIDSVLHDARRFLYSSSRPEYMEVRISLRDLRIFALCARKLPEDGNLRSFLLHVESVLQENAYALVSTDKLQRRSTVDTWMRQLIRSMADEINQWYVTLLGCTPQVSSLTTNEILETIDLVLENHVDYGSLEALNGYQFSTHVEPLRDQMKFLKSLLILVSGPDGALEGSEVLLAHVEAVAINAAYLLFRFYDRDCTFYEEESSEAMESEISTLLQKMMPIDPQVCKIYTRALTSLKLSGQLFAGNQDVADDEAFIPLKNFLGTLICNLWEMLRLNTYGTVSMKPQIQELFQLLRSLRALLRNQARSNFDINIANVVCDAGISVCSLYHAQTDSDHDVQQLLDRINVVVAALGDGDPQLPAFNSPRTSSYAFVDCMLEKLVELATSPAESHVHTIHEELALLRTSLGKVVELRDEHEEVRSLWDRLLEVAYEVESAIDHFVIDGVPHSFDSILKDIGHIKADVVKIKVNELVRGRTYRHMPSQTSPSPSNEVVGFIKEKEAILDRLHGGSKRLQIVSIVGMPGLGKTTLATKAFSDCSKGEHFSARAWCTISQVFNRKNVLLDLFKQVDPKKASETSEKEDDLAIALRKSLKGRRYLLYLDDIWSVEAWDGLKILFPDDGTRSRIILTSRSFDVVRMLDQEPLILSELSGEESLELFQRKIFPGKGNCWPLELHDLGMQMVEKCKGLPLSIILLAGALATIEPGDWEEVLNSVSFVSVADSCRYTLELSYKHLPDHLRPCLVYFGVFPEDQEIQVRRLLRLWIAEGFVRKSETMSLEDVAEGYLKSLVGRSLIMVSKQRCDGGVKTCRIHDLLREYCLQKAKDECFFHFVKGYDELSSFNEPRNLRRLCIDSEPEHVKESKLIYPHVRSLLINSAFKYGGTPHMLHFYKLLKVLDLEKICFHRVFPDEIGQLVLLTFLALRGDIYDIPSWVGNHPNLETFVCIQDTHNLVTLPLSICNMKKLRYLYLRGSSAKACFRFCDANPENSTVLHELDRLSGVTMQKSSVEMVLRMFPNLRKLKCEVYELDGDEDGEVLVFPDFLRQLESLHISNRYASCFSAFDFTSLVNLKKLTLARTQLQPDVFSLIHDQLPNLEILKLQELGFITDADIWEVKEGEFPKLRVLHMSNVRIRRWIACDGYQFESLEKLVLKDMWNLEELPCCLESTETLDMIELEGCHRSLVNVATNIEDVQHNEWGNLGMKTIARRTME